MRMFAFRCPTAWNSSPTCFGQPGLAPCPCSSRGPCTSKTPYASIEQIEVPVCIATDFGAQDLHFFGAFEAWHRLPGEKCLFIGAPGYKFPWSNYQDELVAWYEWRLRGVDNGYAAPPPVRYWLCGAERWRSAADWPIPDAKPQRLHLACTSSSPLVEGGLTSEPAETGALSYLAIPSTSYYVREVDRYEAQVLRWSSAPYETDTEVVGPVTLTLSLQATAIDTYVVVRLSDLASNGKRTKTLMGMAARVAPDDR